MGEVLLGSFETTLVSGGLFDVISESIPFFFFFPVASGRNLTSKWLRAKETGV